MSFWQLEGGRLTLMIAVLAFIGVFSGNWLVAVFLSMGGYIAWMLYQLYKLNAWFSKGLKPAEAPTGGGAWGEIVQQIFRQRTQENKRKKKLKNMLSRFNSTVSALPDATVVLNKDREIEWANRHANSLLNIDASRDTGMRILNLFRTREFSEYIDDKKTTEPMEMVSPLDPAVTLLVQVVHFGKGQRLLLARDISQRIEAQRSRKAFVDNASHELKSPLTVIMGYLEVIEMSPDLGDRLKEPVQRAYEQSQYMHRIIQDLLTLSSLESEAVVSQRLELQDVSLIVKGVVSDMQQSGKAKHHSISVALDETLSVRIAESAITSIVSNLLHNAIEHTPRDTNVNVTWGCKTDGRAYFSVEDDGPGVSADEISHLTERFYRVDRARTRSSGSTGLGLSIVKHSAERFGAALSIRHADKTGLVFEVCFPATASL